MRVLGTVALLAVLATVAVSAVGAAPATPGTHQDEVGVEVTITRHNATTVAYHYDFDLPPEQTGLDVRLYTGGVVERDGFSFRQRPRLLQWNGADTPSFTAFKRVEPGDHCLCVATSSWMLTKPVRVELTSEYNGRSSRLFLTDWLGGRQANATFDVPDGRFTPGVVYLGATEQRHASSPDGQQLMVFAPDSPDQPAAGTVLETLTVATHSFDFTAGPGQPVVLSVVPHTTDTLGGRGSNGLHARGITISNGYAFVDGATGPSTWLHEYVHTQEQYSTASSMDWYVEATASYYGKLMAAQQAERSPEHVIAAFRSKGGPDGILARPQTWDSHFVPYERGGRVVAYLDWRIRAATDGQRSFLDVYRRLNGQRDLTVEDLQAAVASVVGDRSLAEDISTYVEGNATLGNDWGPSDSALRNASALEPSTAGFVPTYAADSGSAARASTAGKQSRPATGLVGSGVVLVLVTLCAVVGVRVRKK
jgi:hypothetical protein